MQAGPWVPWLIQGIGRILIAGLPNARLAFRPGPDRLHCIFPGLSEPVHRVCGLGCETASMIKSRPASAAGALQSFSARKNCGVLPTCGSVYQPLITTDNNPTRHSCTYSNKRRLRRVHKPRRASNMNIGPGTGPGGIADRARTDRDGCCGLFCCEE